MTIAEIVEREVARQLPWQTQPELRAVCCDQHRDGARAACLAVAKAVVEECAQVACYLCREHSGEFDHAHDRPADLIRALLSEARAAGGEEPK